MQQPPPWGMQLLQGLGMAGVRGQQAEAQALLDPLLPAGTAAPGGAGEGQGDVEAPPETSGAWGSGPGDLLQGRLFLPAPGPGQDATSADVAMQRQGSGGAGAAVMSRSFERMGLYDPLGGEPGPAGHRASTHHCSHSHSTGTGTGSGDRASTGSGVAASSSAAGQQSELSPAPAPGPSLPIDIRWVGGSAGGRGDGGLKGGMIEGLGEGDRRA